MNKNWITISLAAFFVIISFLILLDQYLRVGIWFQAKDLHHETFALTAFAFAMHACMVVEDPCGCTPCDVVCCGAPMKEVKAKAKK